MISMDSTKTKALEESYDRIMNVGFCLVPYEDLSDIIVEEPVVFGTTKDERIFSFEGVKKLFESQFEQMKGLTPVLSRNRIATYISPEGNSAYISEENRLTLSSAEEANTIFLRITCLMCYIENKWKLTHWHVSSPLDTENDDWHMKEWKREKEKLQKLVDQKTADLKNKNRELEIEAALERVRAVAMGMKKPEDMLDICRIISEQLQHFGITQIRNVQTAIIDEQDKIYLCYQYFTSYDKELVERTEYLKSEVEHGMVEQMLASKDGHFTGSLAGKELEEFREHRKAEKHFPDPLLDEAKEVSYCFLSIGRGGLGLTLYQPLDAETLALFQRFHQVFSLAYQRFRDIEQARAQAREAQIEAALERVRSRSLAMHSSEELNDVLSVLFHQIEVLGIDAKCAHLTLMDLDNNRFSFRITGRNGAKNIGEQIIDLDAMDAWKDTVEKWKNNEPHSNQCLIYPPEVLPALFELIDESLNSLPAKERIRIKDFPDGLFDCEVHTKYGYLGFNNSRPPTEEEINIVVRFAREFERIYQRFLDLQKAEAQARESEIQLSLERVRARSMSMQKSDELHDVLSVIFDQFYLLGIEPVNVFLSLFSREDKTLTYRATGTGGSRTQGQQVVSLDSMELWQELFEKWKNDNSDSVEVIYYGKEILPTLFGLLEETFSAMPENERLSMDHFPDGGYTAHGYTPFGYIGYNHTRMPSEEEKEILTKFASEFSRVYQRFLDIERAEAQARESEIQLALERIRARTMAMHSSEELGEVTAVLFHQISLLTENPDRFQIAIAREADKAFDIWVTDQEGKKVSKQFSFACHRSPVVLEAFEAWQQKKDILIQDLHGEKLKNWISYVSEEAGLPMMKDHIKDHRYINSVFFSHGCIGTTTNEPLKQETLQLLERFTQVFQQTYIRFLDLQKAEAQAREAQIEASLERIRSKGMAMQCTNDIKAAIAVVFNELAILGIEIDRCGITLINKTPIGELWSTTLSQKNKEVIDIVSGYLDFRIHSMLQHSYQCWMEKKDFSTYTLEGDEVKNYYKILEDQPEYKFPKVITFPEQQVLQTFYFNEGGVFVYTKTKLSTKAKKILRRFTDVFQQTYTRFLDLQKAEKQVAEAIKQSSLDRVRGEIAIMRSTKDLEKITPLIWNELNSLGVPFIRCGVFIIHEDEQEVEVYLSKPDGTSLAVMHLPFDSSELAIQTVAAWKDNRVYKESWTKEEFLRWGRLMMEQHQVPDMETYQGAEDPPESLNLHFIPFNQGMLYVGSSDPLNHDEIDLAVSLAKAFSIAYARYEDFVQLEKAKAAIEIALTELQATQSQLIQQEKLASLGQLSAGIAHEIKNPLNFVTNFSEVSVELIGETREALSALSDQLSAKDKESVSEASEILKNIEVNLQKIHEHGSRADSIVKSMLEHSREGTRVMEPTNLNKLVKEFVNLSFHGMRAGKEPINVDIVYEMDEETGAVPLIAEDFSRVIVNLCNNAFDAMREKRSKIQRSSSMIILPNCLFEPN